MQCSYTNLVSNNNVGEGRYLIQCADDMTDDTQFQRLTPGMYIVPWPHKVLAEGGIHEASKYRRFYSIVGVSTLWRGQSLDADGSCLCILSTVFR